MTTRITAIIALLMFADTVANAQITVTEGNEQISLGYRPCLIVEIPYAEPDEVLSQWDNYIETSEHESSRIRSDEVRSEQVYLPRISSQRLNVYATAAGGEESTTLRVFYEVKGKFISSASASEFAQAKAHLETFAKQMARQKISERLKDAEDYKNNLVANLQKLTEEKAELQEDIEEWEQKIREAKTAIEINEQKQLDHEKAIEQQKKRLEKIREELERY